MKRGFLLYLGIAILIALVVLTLFPKLIEQLRHEKSSVAEVTFEGFKAYGIDVNRVPVGANVTAVLDLHFLQNFSGELVFSVKYDVMGGEDRYLLMEPKSITASAGENVQVNLTFVPEDESGLLYRGYFVEIREGEKELFSLEPQYPPRLKAANHPVIQVSNVFWNNEEGGLITEAGADELVYGHAVLQAVGSAVQKNVLIQIRKDLRFQPDQAVSEKSEFLTIENGSTYEISVPFRTESPGLFTRGYFIEVLVDNKSIYTMPPIYPKRLRST